MSISTPLSSATPRTRHELKNAALFETENQEMSKRIA